MATFRNAVCSSVISWPQTHHDVGEAASAAPDPAAVSPAERSQKRWATAENGRVVGAFLVPEDSLR